MTRRRPGYRRARDGRPTLLAAIALLVASMPLFAGSERLPVALPLASLIAIGILYVALMIRRDKRMPIFEAGSIFVAVTVVYGGFPLVNFIAGGLKWGTFSDNRLQQYRSTAAEVGQFAWYSVALLLSFAVVYLIIRGKPASLNLRIQSPSSAVTSAIVVITLGLMSYFWIMATFFDLSYDQSYVDLREGIGPGRGTNMPLIVLQVSHNLRGILTAEKQMLIVLLISGWRSVKNRVFVSALLALEVLSVVTTFGGRTEMVMLLMTAILAYDRCVRPLSAKVVMIIAAAGLTGIIAYGVARDARYYAEESPRAPFATSSNEFQALWGTAFDLKQHKDAGDLEVPWQIYFSDLYLPIPGQFLPFEKLNPSLWYLDAVVGNRSSGYMFGILAQAAIGFGMYEVIIRGALLALVLALIHRWYARHQASFWATSTYAFLLGWVYYSYRATTFYWIYFFIYRFFPAVVLTLLTALLLQVPSKFRRQNGTSGKEPTVSLIKRHV